MITLEELTIWQARWASLEGTLTTLEKRYQDQELGFPRQDTLCHLVKSLKSFAKAQFDYFYEGFGLWDGLEQSPEYPPEYALSTTLDQVGFDLEIIQRIEQQRRSANVDILDQADKLAQKALQPAVGQNELIKDSTTTVLSYFQKSASIRVIPYASVALIGIPFTASTIPRDYLAIPHEVGHYVYRQGKLHDGRSIPETLDEYVAASPKYIKKWVEEIFADVYGCLIGGPVMALDFQDLQLEYNGVGFTQDDADHPVPFIRPYVYTYVLKKMATFQQSVLKLNDRWQTKLTKRNNPNTFTTATGGQSNLQAAHGRLETVIDKIFAELSNKLTERWSADLAAGEEVEKLYDSFSKDHINALIKGVKVADLTCGEISTTYEGGAQEVVQTKKASRTSKIPVEDWVKKLDADGWNTQGPQGRGG